MSAVPLADLGLSRLMLGTVQLGMPYGVANRDGQPDETVAREIIRLAWEGGVTCLDTAAAYGESEAVLGRALAALGLAGKMTVVTKVRHLVEQPAVAGEAYPLVAACVRESLRRLRLEALPLCLLHREEDARYLECLHRLREQGLVQHVGCSVMTPAAALRIIESGLAEAVQLPASVLDQRFLRQGVFAAARTRGVALFVRSVYLQGLLLMPETQIPASLQGVLPARRTLERLAAEAGMGLGELAFRLALGLDCTSVLVGVETPAQLQANLALLARGPLPADLQQAVLQAVPDLPDDLLMPNRWAL